MINDDQIKINYIEFTKFEVGVLGFWGFGVLGGAVVAYLLLNNIAFFS